MGHDMGHVGRVGRVGRVGHVGASQEGAVPKLGDRAAEIVAEAQQGGPVLAKAVEAALEPLFLRQVREARQQKCVHFKGKHSRNTTSNTNIYK
jgi:hypothetical protein